MALFAVERDGTRIAELDANVASVQWRLNAAGQLAFDADPHDPALVGFRLGGGIEVQWWDDRGELAWWGIPVGAHLAATGRLRISCVSLEGWFDRRRIVTDRAFTGIEQLLIGQRLVEHAQDNAAQHGPADLGIEIAVWTPSGINRDAEYPADERAVIADLLDDLTRRRDGFDWSIEVTADGRREWTPWWPRRGTLRDHLTWQEGGPNRGIVAWTTQLDGYVVNDIHVSSTGDGPDKIWGRTTDVSRGARDGLSTDVRHQTGDVDLDTLEAEAGWVIDERGDPVPATTLTVGPTDVLDPATIRPGDRFDLDVRRGWLTLASQWRAQTVTWRPAAQVAELGVTPYVP